MIRTFRAVALAGLVACSGAGAPMEPATTTSSLPTTVILTAEQAVAAFNACVDETDAELPDLVLDADGRAKVARLAVEVEVLDPAVREALTRCSPILTKGGLLELAGELRNRVMGTLREFARCMRGEGILAFPDPVPGFTGEGDAFPLDEVIRAAPGFAEAAEVCASQMADR